MTQRFEVLAIDPSMPLRDLEPTSALNEPRVVFASFKERDADLTAIRYRKRGIMAWVENRR